MRTPWKTGVEFSTRIVVLTPAKVPVTGLLNGAAEWAKQLYLNDAVSAQAVTITEIGLGHYKVTFTPNAAGYWYLRLTHSTYEVEGWEDELQATDLGLGYSSSSEILAALLDIASAIDNVSIRGLLRLIAANVAGAGAGTASKPFLSLDGAKERIAATFASDGARDAVTKDVT